MDPLLQLPILEKPPTAKESAIDLSSKDTHFYLTSDGKSISTLESIPLKNEVTQTYDNYSTQTLVVQKSSFHIMTALSEATWKRYGYTRHDIKSLLETIKPINVWPWNLTHRISLEINAVKPSFGNETGLTIGAKAQAKKYCLEKVNAMKWIPEGPPNYKAAIIPRFLGTTQHFPPIPIARVNNDTWLLYNSSKPEKWKYDMTECDKLCTFIGLDDIPIHVVAIEIESNGLLLMNRVITLRDYKLHYNPTSNSMLILPRRITIKGQPALNDDTIWCLTEECFYVYNGDDALQSASLQLKLSLTEPVNTSRKKHKEKDKDKEKGKEQDIDNNQITDDSSNINNTTTSHIVKSKARAKIKGKAKVKAKSKTKNINKSKRTLSE